MAKHRAVGDPAPDFELEGTTRALPAVRPPRRARRPALLPGRQHRGLHAAVLLVSRQGRGLRRARRDRGGHLRPRAWTLSATLDGQARAHRAAAGGPGRQGRQGVRRPRGRCAGTKRAVVIVDEDGRRRATATTTLLGLDFQTVDGPARRARRDAARVRLSGWPSSHPGPLQRPAESANGGYTCGRPGAAASGRRSADVSLRAPPPLERAARRGARGRRRRAARRRHAGRARASRPSSVDVPDAGRAGAMPRGLGGRAASSWAAVHPFPTCVVCGPDASRGDGMRVFPARCSGDGCSPPTGPPTPSLDDGYGHVRPECVWAALDCPTSAPVANFGDGPAMVLGAAHRAARLPGARRASSTRSCRGRSASDGRKRHAALRAVRLRRACCWRVARALDRAARAGVGSPAWPSTTTAPARSARPPAAWRSRLEGREVVSVRGDERRRLQPRLHLPQGARAQAAARGPRPADARRSCGATASCAEATWDEAFAEIDRRLSPHPRGARPQRRGRLPRQPDRAQPVGAHLRPGAAARAGLAEHLLARRRSTRCPSRSRPA